MIKKTIMILLGIYFCVLLGAGVLYAMKEIDTNKKVKNKMAISEPSVVPKNELSKRSKHFVDRTRSVKLELIDEVTGRTGIGSGIILNSKGDILTAFHVFNVIQQKKMIVKQWKITDSKGDVFYTSARCDVSVEQWDVCVIRNTEIKHVGILFTKEKQNVIIDAYPSGHHVRQLFKFQIVERADLLFDGVNTLMGEGSEHLDVYRAENRQWKGASGGGLYNERGDCLGMLVAGLDEMLSAVPADVLAELMRQHGIDVAYVERRK